MRRYKSDTWDTGNYLTRFYEVYRDCEKCGGTGTIVIEVHESCGKKLGECVCDDEEGGEIIEKEVKCNECGGFGELIYYE